MAGRVLRYLKLAEESEFSVAPAPSPQATLDIASATLDTPSDTQAIWEGGIGRGPRLHRPGFYAPTGNVVVPVDVHTVGWFLRWVLGGYAFDADNPAPGTNLHEFYGATDTVLPSFTAWLGKDLPDFEHFFRGCMASQLALQVSDGYAQLTVDVIAARDGSGTLDENPLDSLVEVPPMTFPHAGFWVGGTTSGDEESAKITDLTLTINNNGDAAAARGLGSRFPQRAIPANQRDTTFQFTTFYDSKDHVERVWGGATGPSDDGSTELPVRIGFDSGTDGSLIVDLPRSIFTQVQTQPTGRTRIDQQVNGTALLDTVVLDDAVTEVESEICAKLQNDHGEYAAA